MPLTSHGGCTDNAAVPRLATLAALFVLLWLSASGIAPAPADVAAPVVSSTDATRTSVVGHEASDDGRGPASVGALAANPTLPGHGFAGVTAAASLRHHPGGIASAPPARLHASPHAPVLVLRNPPLLI